MSFGLDIGREGVDRVFGQEVVDVEFVDADFCLIGHQLRCQHALGIEGDERAAFQFHVSFAFVQRHVGGVAGAIGSHSSVDLQAIGNAIGAAHLGIDQCDEEVQLLGLAIHCDVGLHAVEVCDVLCLAFDRRMDSCGQIDVDACHIQLLHVSVDGASDVQRMIGEMLHELLGQLAHVSLDVLLA